MGADGRTAGAGRKPLPLPQVPEGIFYALRTGVQWKALPMEYGAADSIRQRSGKRENPHTCPTAQQRPANSAQYPSASFRSSYSFAASSIFISNSEKADLAGILRFIVIGTLLVAEYRTKR
jgi:hypothetical protein